MPRIFHQRLTKIPALHPNNNNNDDDDDDGCFPFSSSPKEKEKSARTGNDVRALSVRCIEISRRIDRSIDRSITKSRIASPSFSNVSFERKIPEYMFRSPRRDARVVGNIQTRFEIALFPNVLFSLRRLTPFLHAFPSFLFFSLFLHTFT